MESTVRITCDSSRPRNRHLLEMAIPAIDDLLYELDPDRAQVDDEIVETHIDNVMFQITFIINYSAPYILQEVIEAVKDKIHETFRRFREQRIPINTEIT